MELTNRKLRRARALAKQIYDAGVFYPCNCGLSGCTYRATPKSRAEKIINGQRAILKLDEVTIREALRMVQLI
jgi:hypothetical protein